MSSSKISWAATAPAAVAAAAVPMPLPGKAGLRRLCVTLTRISPESFRARGTVRTMNLRAVVSSVLKLLAASRGEGQAHSDLQSLNTKLPLLLQLTEETVDKSPLIRKMVAIGIAPIVKSQLTWEGKDIASAEFAGSLKRCVLLWKILLKEIKACNCPQRLLLKLEYCQRFCIQAFNRSSLDTKRSLVSENAASITFGLDLSIAVLQGLLLSEPRQLAGTMISFFQQFNQYLSYDTAPISPSCCQEVLTRLTVTSEPNKHDNVAIVLILTAVLHCASHYGWYAAIGDEDLKPLLMTMVHSQLEKLSIISKALLALMPGTVGVEVLLNKEQLSLIVKQLSTVGTSTMSCTKTTSSEYSVRELSLIIKATTRVDDNRIGLLEEGVEEVLGSLIEQEDEIANAIAADVTTAIATGGVYIEDEVMERSSSTCSLDPVWDYGSLQGSDLDGTIAFVDILLHQLAKLALDKSLSAENVMKIETLVLTVFDIYWQSELKVKNAVAELIGDKYIQCLYHLHEVLTSPKDTDTAATSIGYNILMQELARRSTYFCEKASAGGFIGLHLATVENLLHFVETEVILNSTLTILFYCAHVKILHYSEFGVVDAIDTLARVLQSPAAHTRLLTRLVICCLLPILEDHHKTLLKMTDEESQLLLAYVKEVKLPGGLDPAKFLMATSILYSDVCPWNSSEQLSVTVAETVVQHIFNIQDNCILESTLCLLWTLCHTPAIVQTLSQIDNLIPRLKAMQQTQYSAVPSLAKGVLWKLGYGNHQDNAECYHYACTCLHYWRYTECIEQCDHIMTTAPSSLHGEVRQLRGKCFAHLHQKQFWNVIKQRGLDVAVPLKCGNLVDQCANSAKAAVKDLGFALDHGVLDEEGSYLMDIAMLQYILIKNQLRDCNRCLLCRRKGLKLKESHICPKFVLKEVTQKHIEKLQGHAIAESIDKHFHSVRGRFVAHTSKTARYAILCGKCEQVLSQNGEDQFQKNIMPLIYVANDEMQTAKYDSTLYSFCLGIVFRFFVQNILSFHSNASEIYSLLVACRHHLLSLPVKYSEADPPNPPPVTAIPMTPFEAFLFPSPEILHITNSRLFVLTASMAGTYGAWYLTAPLSTEPATMVTLCCHALVVRLGFFNIVIPFSPAWGGTLDRNCHVNPDGGEYQLLPDIERWEILPSGLLHVFVTYAYFMGNQYQQVLSGMITTKKDSKKVDAYIDACISMHELYAPVQQPINASSLQLLPPKVSKLISMFLSNSLPPVIMLPAGFHIRDTPPQVILKEGYMLLHHIHIEEENATFFFAANPEDLTLGKLIVIMKYTEDMNFESVEGVNIHIREDDSSCSICVTGFLLEPATEALRHSRYRIVSGRLKNALNVLAQKCGSLKVFLHHARSQMRMKNNPCLDKKCSLNGCWYCMDRCHICMEPAIQDYTSVVQREVLVFKHCSAECKAIVDDFSQLSTELHPANQLKQIPNKHLVLASIMGCLASVMSTRTVVQVNVCVSVERSSIMYGRPYATVQLHTEEQNVLFSVYLCDDLSPTQPADDFPQAFPFQMLLESNLVKEIFQMSLHPLEIFSISHLLREATKADFTLANMFSISCSPYENKLCWEETMASLNSSISQEVLFTRWMLEQVIFVCEDKEEVLQVSSSENPSQESTPLIPSSSACCTLFWAYFQLTCLLWKKVLNGNGALLFQKITYVTHITVKLYEQSSSGVQKHITDAFCSRVQIFLLCGQIAVAAIKGGLPPSIHEPAVELLLLAHKLTAMVRTASEPMKSIFARHLYQELKQVQQDDVQRRTKVSAVAQQLLLTLILKSHTCDVSRVETVSIQTFLNSPFIIISILARAVAVSLLQCCPQIANDTETTNKELDFLSRIIHDLTEDSLKRRYFFHLILQALTLLCSQPVNADQFANHSITNGLEALMECADGPEYPDIIANVLWKITIGGGLEKTTETAGTFEVLPGEEIPIIDICLDVEQGLCETAEKLLMIIHEFCSIYLECKHVHESHSYTVSSAAQLLCDLHQTMDRREKEEVVQFVSQNGSILTMLSLAISRHRKSWLHCFNGILTRSAIESLFVTWTDCSGDFCQVVAESGVLRDTANTLHWALEPAALNTSDFVCLQNQVLIIYNVAQKYPKQAAFELQLTCLQPLLNCSSLPLRIISKSIVAFLADYMDNSVVATLSLTNEEVKFFADSFASFINSGTISTNEYEPKFSVEELLFSFQKLSSLPWDKSCCTLPCLLNALSALSLHDDKTIATSALEDLWNISMEPTVALAILCHENVVCTLQNMSVFNNALADLARSILWILGYGNTEDITGCCGYAVACYKFGKYTEAISWCDHILHMAPRMHPIVSRVKSCKGKALAQVYLQKQLQRLQKSDQMSMLGHDGNSEFAEAMILDNISSHPSAIDNELLHQLCFADLQNWKSLCSQGQQAIELLGEVLDSGELDEQGSELLDWVMMDYCRESGETSDCKRCLLCRNIGELVPLAPKSNKIESLASESILSLHSFMHIKQPQNLFVFCKDCESVLSMHNDKHVQSFLDATNYTHGEPVTYGRVIYLHLIVKFAQKLPLAYTGYCSNWKDIYNTFVACRQILLSHDIDNGTIYYPKIYLFNNPDTWYVFTNSSANICSFSSSRNMTAMIASKQSLCKGGTANQFQFLMMYTEGCTILVDFYSEEGIKIPSQYLINPAGGSYPILRVSERWEAFPQEVIRGFQNLASADERRKNVFQDIWCSKESYLSSGQQLSTRFWLPQKCFFSFLPEEFSLEVDSDAIRNISLPEGHKILGHTHDRDKNLTIFLAYATNFVYQEKQFYFIFTCKLHNYFIAARVFLSGVAIELIPSSSPVMFFLGGSSMPLVHLLTEQKVLVLEYLRVMLMSYGNFGFEAVSTYEDITRNANLAVSVDKKCSPEGCWYCHHRCHSCMKPASVGYTWKDGDSGQLFYHCSNRCYHMYTGDIPESTILDVKVGEIQHVSEHGAHLLLSATVLQGKDLSTNSVVSMQVAISYGSKEIPDSVVYVITQLKKMENPVVSIAAFIQHDLTLVKYVWDFASPEYNKTFATAVESLRESNIIKENLQPVFTFFGCDDLPSFLEQKFPHLRISFMDQSGVIYPWPPNSEQSETSKDSLMGEGGDDDSTPNGST